MSVHSEAPRANTIVLGARVVVFIALLGAVVLLMLNGDRFPRWSDLVAIVVALMCAGGAARLFVESFDPVMLGKRMGVEGESTAKEANQVRVQALLTLVLGFTLAWPPLATLNGWPAPMWSYIVIVAFVAIRVGYTNYMFHKGDEFLRQRVRVHAWRTYFIGLTALLAYAGAERLGLAPAMTSWDVLTSMLALSILVSVFGQRFGSAA